MTIIHSINLFSVKIKFNLMSHKTSFHLHPFYLLCKALECRCEFVSQFSLSLFCRQIITVVHVLMLTKICCDLTHFSVELYIYMFLFAKHDCMLSMEKQKCITVAFINPSTLTNTFQNYKPFSYKDKTIHKKLPNISPSLRLLYYQILLVIFK